MPMAADILEQIKADFPAADVPSVLTRLEAASENERVLRCIVFAARGNPWYFDFLCRLAKIDHRRVIMAAEGGQLYDFTKPIPEARLPVDRYPRKDVVRKEKRSIPMAADILEQIKADFPAADLPSILARLEASSENERVLRCIVFAARGHPWYFDFLCRLAKIDYRDVIMAAEYERLGDHLYDFTKPIPGARLPVDRYPSNDVLRK
jgi:hypothetical protein